VADCRKVVDRGHIWQATYDRSIKTCLQN